MIAAAAKNNALGKENDLVWHLPDDFKRFKRDYTAKGAVVVHTLERAIEIAKDDPQPFIIGGGEIYELALPFAEKIELTRVHSNFEADTFFPELDENKWKLVKEEFHPTDEKHKYAITYLTYERR